MWSWGVYQSLHSSVLAPLWRASSRARVSSWSIWKIRHPSLPNPPTPHMASRQGHTCGCTPPHETSCALPGKNDLLRLRHSGASGSFGPDSALLRGSALSPHLIVACSSKAVGSVPLRLGVRIWGLCPQWDIIACLMPLSTQISCLRLDGAKNFLHD